MEHFYWFFFVGKNFDKSDKKNPAPKLEGLFDGSQDDIFLTLPDDINVKDLKWISIWCRRFGISFGQFIFPASTSDNVVSDTETKTDAIASESGKFTDFLKEIEKWNKMEDLVGVCYKQYRHTIHPQVVQNGNTICFAYRYNY